MKPTTQIKRPTTTSANANWAIGPEIDCRKAFFISN